jgi:hypothetical protein
MCILLGSGMDTFIRLSWSPVKGKKGAAGATGPDGAQLKGFTE